MVSHTRTKSLAEIAYRRPLRECSVEELAIHQITATPSSGILFARKERTEQKDLARSEVIELFRPEKHPKGLSILTLPGLDWRFERKLLGVREGDWFNKKGPHRTYITSAENDRSIYRAAVLNLPGINHADSVVTMLPMTSFAESAVRNVWINRYFLCNVDELMASQSPDHQYDAAWLDYTGPMSIQRLDIIRKFFQESIRHTIVITTLRARWSLETTSAIGRAGGYAAWVIKTLPGRVLHDIEYQDGSSPMSQIAITHDKESEDENS